MIDRDMNDLIREFTKLVNKPVQRVPDLNQPAPVVPPPRGAIKPADKKVALPSQKYSGEYTVVKLGDYKVQVTSTEGYQGTISNLNSPFVVEVVVGYRHRVVFTEDKGMVDQRGRHTALFIGSKEDCIDACTYFNYLWFSGQSVSLIPETLQGYYERAIMRIGKPLEW